MNIINQQFDNTKLNLAIVIYPTIELNHPELEAKMTEFTLFYAKRFNQIVGHCPQIPIYTARSIGQAMATYSDKHEHILFMAAGVRIYDMSILFDIAEQIGSNPQYLAAAHILDWGSEWYELHQQFILVNSANWRSANCPEFGDWEPGNALLPVIQRSVENFHDGYTPLWITFTGEWLPTRHQHPGWKFLEAAAKHNMTIINWPGHIRLKRTYYYPEDRSAELLESLTTLEHRGITNGNQRSLITQLGVIKDQIWLLNSEDMKLPHGLYDTIALTASGFKFLEVFRQSLLTTNGKLIIYDFNPLSLEWIKLVHSSDRDIVELVDEFEHRKNFKILSDTVHDTNGNQTAHFHTSLAETVNYFGGAHEFAALLAAFRAHPVIFAEANIISAPETLTQQFTGNTLINVSNIFCTDFSNAVWGMAATIKMWDQFISAINTTTRVVGHDATCAFVDHIIIK